MKKKLLAATLSSILALSTLVTGCGSGGSGDGTFTPSKSIQWTCTSSPGGGSDIFTRMIGDIMTEEGLVNGQTIVVTNKTDGAGEVGRNEVATMNRDADYQLLTFNSGDLMPMVLNTKNRASNFKILAIMAVDKQLLFVTPQSKYQSMEEILNACQAGEQVNLVMSKGDDEATYQKLLAATGISDDVLVGVSEDSTGDAITGILGNHYDIVMSKPAAAAQYVESGDLIPILALSTERYTGNLADAPTLSELGDYEDVEVPVWRGVAGPAAMSDAAVQYWTDALKKVSETEKWANDYIATNKLVANYMDAASATEYVTKYEADYMAEQGIK